MIFPDLDTCRTLSASYNRIPVYKELNIAEPGHLLLLKVLEESGDLIFFESLGENSENTRFSFLGIHPKKRLRFQDNTLFINDEIEQGITDEGVFDFIRKEVDTYSSPAFEEFGHFNGGLAGYFGYGMVNYCGILRKKIRESKDVPQIELLYIDDFIAHDNENGVYHIATCIYPNGDIEKSYNDAKGYLDKMESEIIEKISKTTMPYMPAKAGTFTPKFNDTKEEFMRKVSDVVGMIDGGEALQVVLSMKAEVPDDVDPYKFYLQLRKLNPSPYMFYIKSGSLTIAGSSPEVHVKSERGIANLRPIAGTAPRTGDQVQDEENCRIMLEDPKERAEHLMLVDLARNDLSRIARPESVRVTRFMEPENYSHVIHLVSDVVADLDEDKHIVDVLRESFPAGTVSGAPKVRAIEIIDETEKDVRNIYSGAVGYIGYNDFMDTCITIRTAYFTDQGNFIQAGAGIVQDSVPEKEYIEICNKLGALSVSLPFAMKNGKEN